MTAGELCDVYKSSREQGLYLFVLREKGLDDVPETLLQKFGKPALVTSFILTAERRLARCSGEQVIEAIDKQGFYLQMPPRADEYMSSINRHNSKL